MKKESYKIIIAILTTAIVVGAGVFIWNNPSENTGIIEGRLSYPSDHIPKDMEICAENTKTGNQYCTSNNIYDGKYNPNEHMLGAGYKLQVPIGDYQVYAYLPDSPDWKAYYSDYVVCTESGLYENCNSHDPIAISVLSDQVITDINPGDWYK